ncbi:MAG: BTAD domain-containing putative transcriptional regulator [Anaerolineae bacterium]
MPLVSVPLLIANRHTIQLNPAGSVSIDTIQFDSLLSRTQTHDRLNLLTCHTCREDLSAATSLYTGHFLADFYLEDSNEFEEWAEIRRQKYLRKTLDSLESLTTIAIRQQAYAEAHLQAERQLELDDLRESAYQQLMEVLARNGQRNEALAVYETCRRHFTEEMGMAPSARTTGIYEKILAGDLRLDSLQEQGVRGYELQDEIGAGAYGVIHRAI